MSVSQELEQYHYQLNQIDAALQKDPNNQDLLQLHSDLIQVIQLTSSLHLPPSTSPATANTTFTPKFAVGDDVIARYSRNNKLYRGTVSSIKTVGVRSSNDIQYMIIFDGYQDPELVLAVDVFSADCTHLLDQQQQLHNLKKISKQACSTPSALGPALTVSSVGSHFAGNLHTSLLTPTSSGSTSSTNPHAVNPRKLDAPILNNNCKSSKRAAREKTVESEHKARQLSWQQFSGTGLAAKKKVGISKHSIFATPDNPFAKVGVTGSGRGMTEVKDRTRHKFNPY